MRSDQKLQIGRVFEIFIGERELWRKLDILLWSFADIQSFFYCLFAGKFSAYFDVIDIQHGKFISLRTKSVFLFFSAISIDFQVRNNSSSIISIQHYFDINSKLFHDTLGIPLRKFYHEKFHRALRNLERLLCELQSEGLLLWKNTKIKNRNK
jgi:hypothetical protein